MMISSKFSKAKRGASFIIPRRNYFDYYSMPPGSDSYSVPVKLFYTHHNILIFFFISIRQPYFLFFWNQTTIIKCLLFTAGSRKGILCAEASLGIF